MMLTRMTVAGMALLVLLALGGAGLVTCRAVDEAPAEKATPPARRVTTRPPVVETAPEERKAHTFSTANFKVTAPTREIARQVALTAEKVRKFRAWTWLGEELPPWDPPCPVEVKPSLAASGGYSTFTFEKGKVSSRAMRFEGSLDQVLIRCVAHEVTHALLADHFGEALPRWADEGIATISEGKRELERHEELARKLVVGSPERVIPLKRLFRMYNYPRDVAALYAQGASVVWFILGKDNDCPKFLKFLRQGMKGEWDRAVKAHYGYKDVADLERAWVAYLKKQPKAPPPDQGNPSPAPGPRAAGAEKRPAPVPPPVAPAADLATPSAGPLPGLASVRDREWVRVTVKIHAGGGVYAPVHISDETVTYRWEDLPRATERTSYYSVKDVTFYDTRKNKVAPGKALKRLEKETPALVTGGIERVDPLLLRLMKEDTLILLVPARTSGRQAPTFPEERYWQGP